MNGKKNKTAKNKTNKRTNTKPFKIDTGNKGDASAAIKKVRVNDPNTGRLIWIFPEDLKKFEALKNKIVTKREKKKEQGLKKEYSKLFDTPIKDVKKNLYDNVDSLEKLEALKSKYGRIRYKGKFIPAEAEKRIFEFAKILDRQNAEWNLTEMLKVPKIQNKIIITSDRKDGVPKYRFYWALHNAVRKGKFGEPEIIIYDFNRKVVYKGTNAAEATEITNKLSRRIEAVEKIAIEKENTNPYFMVPVYETKRDGHVLKIEIEFNGTDTQLPRDKNNFYRDLL